MVVVVAGLFKSITHCGCCIDVDGDAAIFVAGMSGYPDDWDVMYVVVVQCFFALLV